MPPLRELALMIQSRYPFIAVETAEEERLETALSGVASDLRVPFFVWTVTTGLQRHGLPNAIYDSAQPLKGLNNVATLTGEAIFLMKDLHRYLTDAAVVRKCLDLAPAFGHDRRVIVISAVKVELPAELAPLAARFTLDLPGPDELRSVVKRVVTECSRQRPVSVGLAPADLERLVDRLRGFTEFEAERAVTQVVLRDHTLDAGDIDLIVEIKKEMLRKDSVLEYISPEENLAEVGGFKHLKAWLAKRKKAFAPEARQFGIESPRGILLLGVQGCLRGDSRVLLADGRMPTLESLARQVSDGLEPGVYDVAHQVALEDGKTGRATRLHIHAGRETILVRFAGARELELTPDHEVLTPLGWKRADLLAPGDEVKLWVRAGDFVTPPKRTGFGRPLHSVRVRTVPVDSLPDVWTPELAELVGLFAAEGSRDRYRVERRRPAQGLASFRRNQPTKLGDFARVTSTETGRRLDRVYDLTVPGPDRYIANGLVVHNCGKTLVARAVAREWGLPLLKMEPGRLYDKFIGETEKNLEKALRMAEQMAPCVLMIDELEKGLSYQAGGDSDAGLSKRVFGRLLSWLQDRKAPVFVVATSNDIEQLPPELTRKGRFDEIFFVDLPSAEERREIFAVHLRKRKRDPKLFDLAALAAAAEGFSGAEIEQAVVAALYTAFSHGVEVTSQIIAEELKATKPLSVTRAEHVAALREWARDRTVMAG